MKRTAKIRDLVYSPLIKKIGAVQNLCSGNPQIIEDFQNTINFQKCTNKHTNVAYLYTFFFIYIYIYIYHLKTFFLGKTYRFSIPIFLNLLLLAGLTPIYLVKFFQFIRQAAQFRFFPNIYNTRNLIFR